MSLAANGDNWQTTPGDAQAAGQHLSCCCSHRHTQAAGQLAQAGRLLDNISPAAVALIVTLCGNMSQGCWTTLLLLDNAAGQHLSTVLLLLLSSSQSAEIRTRAAGQTLSVLITICEKALANNTLHRQQLKQWSTETWHRSSGIEDFMTGTIGQFALIVRPLSVLFYFVPQSSWLDYSKGEQ